MSSGANQRWWEEDPGRLQLELAKIRELTSESDWSVNDEGRLLILTAVTFEDKPVPVRVVFSADHPFVAPTLYGEVGLIERHQNPISGNFCIVDNEEHWWEPRFTGSLLVEELQKLLDATATGEVAAGEHPMPEPLSGHVKGRLDQVVLITDPLLADDLTAERGTFELTAVSEHQWVVTEMRGEDGTVIAALPTELCSWLGIDQGHHQRSTGGWQALPDPPRPGEVLNLTGTAVGLMKERMGDIAADAKRRRRDAGRPELWAAVSFREQGPVRDQERRAWFFYAAQPGRRGGLEESGLPIKTQALSQEVREERILELRGLNQCRFLIVGAGALGAPVALELAKADAGHIDIVDGDHYDLNNGVRHPLSATAAGLAKGPALAALTRSLSPFTNAEPHELTVGGGEQDRARLGELVDEATVVVDATGMHDVTRVLHLRACDAGGGPLVSAGLSLGGYGGRVLVLRQSSPCFDCYLHDPEVVWPQAGSRSDRTPYGCSHPAASCAGFDALELSANIARTAVRATGAVSYPPLDFNWATINFRPGGPRWSQGHLARQPDCPWCS